MGRYFIGDAWLVGMTVWPSVRRGATGQPICVQRQAIRNKLRIFVCSFMYLCVSGNFVVCGVSCGFSCSTAYKHHGGGGGMVYHAPWSSTLFVFCVGLALVLLVPHGVGGSMAETL